MPRVSPEFIERLYPTIRDRGRQLLRLPLVLSLALVSLHGCSSAGTMSGGSIEGFAETVVRAEERNQVESATRVEFKWSLTEPDLRIGGQGVARIEPGRARLDLFLGNGLTVLTAALIGDELRVPQGGRLEVVPRPPLLWAALGVFRPGSASEFLGGESNGTKGVTLRYRISEDEELLYGIEADRLTGVVIVEDGHIVHRMDLTLGEGELPEVAVYRNMAAFRELTVTVESVEQVASHPAEVWDVGN